MVTVRPAQAPDADAIGEIHVRAWQHGYRGQMPDDYLDALSVPDRQQMWRARLVDGLGENTLLVAEDPLDGHVCGWVTTGPLNPAGTNDLDPSVVGELWAINLEPEAWGRNIATALMARAVDALAAAGSSEAILWVLSSNARARRFYEREGWCADGGRKVDTREWMDLVEDRYRRTLPSTATE